MTRFLTLFIIIIIGSLSVFSQEPVGEVVQWKAGRQLMLKDFTIVPDTSSRIPGNNLAVTNTGIISALTPQPRSKNLEIRLAATMYPQRSFIKQAAVNAPDESIDYLLGHEQKHFDISEIFVREAIRQMEPRRFTKNYENEIRALMQTVFEEAKKWHDAYDIETRHGRDAVAQKLWNEKIAGKLRELDRFNNKTLNKRIY